MFIAGQLFQEGLGEVRFGVGNSVVVMEVEKEAIEITRHVNPGVILFLSIILYNPAPLLGEP